MVEYIDVFDSSVMIVCVHVCVYVHMHVHACAAVGVLPCVRACVFV